MSERDAPALVVHLSDLHLCQPAETAPPEGLRASLIAAIGELRARAGARVAVVVTGDLLDSSAVARDTARATIRALVEDLRRAIGPGPIVLLPGNHDRRGSGVISPWSHDLVRELARAAHEHEGVTLFAADGAEPLAGRLGALSELLGCEVVAYDTTHTLDGKFSAGGLFRPEDLLAVRSIVGSTRPVMLLMHHHLVPTPITDVEAVNTAKKPLWQQVFVERVLPWAVSFGNREELFMTALGAGTALTLLHALGAPVLVLHGHKHYPAARVLAATGHGDGDVLLSSAGSAGLLERYYAAGPDDETYLWPSFNAVWIDDGDVEIETIFFSPDGTRPTYRRALAVARRRDLRWECEPVPPAHVAHDEVAVDRAGFTLSKGGAGFWDFTCERSVTPAAGALDDYDEPILGTRRAHFTGEHVHHDHRGRAVLRVRPHHRVRYRGTNALCRTLEEAVRQYPKDEFSPFEWIGLAVRRGARTARIDLEGLPDAEALAFGTVTDLHTGQQTPHALARTERGVALEVSDCPARRLLRIHWPLSREDGVSADHGG